MTDANYWGINGKISPSVASNNLTVAIQDYDGSNFSALNPLVHKIGGVPRVLVGALSVTINAGALANTFNAGAAMLATLEIDYFVYLGWRASDSSMFVLVSRIPYARTYGDFSGTATNEKYGAFSGTTPASTDPVVNVGRFNAVNSGTASFNWSIPATSIVINHPILETRWLDWSPTPTGFSAVPTNTAYRYHVDGNTVNLVIRQGTAGTSNATTFTIPLPFTAKTVSNTLWANQGTGNDNGSVLSNPVYGFIASAASVLDMRKDSSTAAWTASSTKGVRSLELFYEI